MFPENELFRFSFAEDKNIKGKKDSGRHEGKASEIRRIQEAEESVKEAIKDLPKPPVKG